MDLPKQIYPSRSSVDGCFDVSDSELEISELSASSLETLEKSVHSVISPVDLTELVMSLRDRVVSVALVAVDGTVWLLLLVGTTVSLLLVSVLLGHGLVAGLLVSVALLLAVRLLGGLVSVRLLGGGGLVGGLGLVGRSLGSGVVRVVAVRSKSGGRVSSGVVTVGGVRVVGLALKGSLLLSLGVSIDVGGVGPWVLGVLTVEVEMGSVDGLSSTDGAVVSVGVSDKGVVCLDLLLGVATPVVVSLRLVVGVGAVVVDLSGVGLSGIGALKVGWVVVSGHSGVDGPGLLVRGLVLWLVAVVVVLGGVSDREKSKSE